MRVADVFDRIDEGYERLVATLDRMSRERMEAPGVDGGWSAKAIVAHITWAEREMVGVLQRRALVGSDLWNLSQDERNAAVYAENRERPLDEVLSDARTVFAALRAEIARLSDAEMTDPALIAGMPGGLAPWQLLAGNTWKHYEEHLPALQALAEAVS
ncbi:MAG TPA: DinB family protein [Ktedonobacterales bacterium]|jgi:uncharacterized damage-inducible protein DinB|nr:DinB family protein [Ktedonobacterales bacterium]